MSDLQTDTTPPADRPFGTKPGRSNAPIYVLGALFALWIGVLVWMAFVHQRV